MAAFAPCLAFTLRAEGGYGNDPQDPGSATNMGITEATLSAWRGEPCTPADVKALSLKEATAIYTLDYWTPVSGAELPAGIDLMTWDFGVNAGPGRSVKMLQRVVGSAQDGVMGPHTLLCAKDETPAVLRTRLVALSNMHEAYYKALPGFSHDGKGWSARVSACLAQSLALAAGSGAALTPAFPKPRATPPPTHAAAIKDLSS